MKRYLYETILSDAISSGKMAFVSGPRQVGKTTLGECLVPLKQNRFNWDDTSFKLQWSKNPNDAIGTRTSNLILFDEIHKDRLWKSKLKGIYDTNKNELKIVVTGSARLDVFRKGGDSLLGRYFPYQLHPFTVNELETPPSAESFFGALLMKEFGHNSNLRFLVDDLLNLTGFPEPLLGGSKLKAMRWSRLRLERLLQEDVRDLRNISDLQTLKLLVQLLPTKVGSPFSINSLRQNLNVSYATIRDWVLVLESLFIHFTIFPYSKKLSRMLVQEPKIYLFDGTAIPERGLQLENLTALHLQKACHFWSDSAQGEYKLHYLRNKEKMEVDFCLLENNEVKMLLECKSNNTEISKSLLKFSAELNCPINIQLVDIAGYKNHYPAKNVSVLGYDVFLKMLV
jgi:uncharacterized protein